jgi:hypothetical protein
MARARAGAVGGGGGVSAQFSVVFTGERHARLSAQLTRPDGQEDVCFALWRASTGASRLSAVVGDPVLPEAGERTVRGTAWFTGDYALRAARAAAAVGAGLALLHSHPGGRSWQFAPDGSADAETERKIANLAREITGYPLVGLTLGTGSQEWSARCWSRGEGTSVSPIDAESVRVFGGTFRVAYHPQLRPAPAPQPTQIRTVHSWGDEVQAHLARLRVLVVGGGSVGQLVLEMLARTGVEFIGVMDFDTVERVNLDRLHGATRLDALLVTSKAELGYRLMQQAATAGRFEPRLHEESVCEPDGLRAALDYDVIFCCVDRPWPRHVLNTIAFSDALPVIDGGVRLEPGQSGLRNAYWRSHIAGAGRACIRCVGQYNVADVQLERDGSLDNPTYIASLPNDSPLRVRQNVYATSLAAASALTNQFLSLVVAPSGFGDPGALRYDLRQHRVDPVEAACPPACAYVQQRDRGDGRVDPTGRHAAAQEVVAARHRARAQWQVRAARRLVKAVRSVEAGVARRLAQPQ